MAKLAEDIYSKALFDMSVEHGAVDRFASEAALIREALEAEPEWLLLLTHPELSAEEKKDLVENCFKGKVSDDLTGFLVVVTKAKRADRLIQILDKYEKQVREYQRRGTAFVTSAAALSEEQKRALEKKLLETTQYTSYEIHYSVDVDLIGGLRIRIGDRLVDSSIRTRLDEMKKCLMNMRIMH